MPFKQAHYRVTSSVTRSIVICLCSRLTSGSGLSHSIALVSFVSLKQAHYRFVPFKQASYRVTGSTTRSILVCHCSRLTSGSCLLHACSRACFVRAYYTHVVGLVSFMPTAFDRACLLFDELNQEVNYWLVIVAGSLRVTGSTARSIVICPCSRLTILVIQAGSFYSASNIQR